MVHKTVILLLLCLIAQVAMPQRVAVPPGQETRKHSPHKASVYSAVLPGLGQVYNKKYWKVPIVYAGVGTITYLALLNRAEYREARDAYIYVANGETYPIDNKFVGRYSASDLVQIRNYYRRNTEVSWILLGAWYILNIVDATVDAHFFDYDISESLTLQLNPASPAVMPLLQPAQNGLNTQQWVSIRFTF